ncbi:hypothetical protein E2C01_049721 [Portunus trituberculatus]|uniref:Uncharacterized protein n=1 Tax=Portunus trituberculatus TaxID=210409 RepID=A0A5B7GF42_PORTR|nr:hypothetical protein [Portunus trituberculatus]
MVSVSPGRDCEAVTRGEVLARVATSLLEERLTPAPPKPAVSVAAAPRRQGGSHSSKTPAPRGRTPATTRPPTLGGGVAFCHSIPTCCLN